MKPDSGLIFLFILFHFVLLTYKTHSEQQLASFFSEFIAFANQSHLHNVYIKRPNVADL